MAITVVAASTTAAAGTTNTATTTPVTPALPAGTASGDRVFVYQASSQQALANPTGWTSIAKNVVVGSGTPAAGAGLRYISIYYRDYDGVWTMPAFGLTSTAQNSNAVAAVTFRKASNEVWDTPTVASAPGLYFPATPGTAYSATSPTMTVNTGGMTFGVTALNDNVSSTAPGGTTTGGIVLGTRVEQYDNGTATGNDVRLVVGTASVTTGGTGTITRTSTLSAASQGGTLFGQQTVTVALKAADLVENFSAATLDTAKFTVTQGTPTIESGRLRLNDVASGTIVSSTQVLDLTSSSLFLKVVPSAGLNRTNIRMHNAANTAHLEFTFTSASAFFCQWTDPNTTAGTNSSASITGVPSTGVYLRFRWVSAGKTAFDYSYNTSTWTPITIAMSENLTFDLASLRLRMTATGGTGASPTYIDDINTALSAPSDSYGQVVFADGPAAWWRGNGSTADYMNGTAGVLTNGATYGQFVRHNALADQSFSFDGVNDFVRVEGNATLRPNAPVTMEAWVIPATTPSGFHSVMGPGTFLIEREGGKFILYQNSGGGPAGNTPSLVGSTTIIPGVRYHVAAVWSGGVRSLYVNGVLDASDAYTSFPQPTTQSFFIGAWDGTAEYWDGQIGEAALYAKALTATQIKAHFNAGSLAKAATLTESFADATRLSLGPSATVTNNRLQLTATSNYDAYAVFLDQHKVSLVESSAFVEIVQLANGSTNTETFFWASDMRNGADDARFSFANGALFFQNTSTGPWSSVSVPYDPVAHRYLRFRGSANGSTLYWDTSPDAITWTQRYSHQTAMDLSAIRLDFGAGGAGGGTSLFDNLNIAPSTLVVRDKWNGTALVRQRYDRWTGSVVVQLRLDK